MPTKLTKKVTRETLDGRIVILNPEGTISFRRKGRRTMYHVSIHRAYQMAVYETLYMDWQRKLKRHKELKAMGRRTIYPRKPSFEIFAKEINKIYSLK
jgi:hypothetical protein